MASAQSVGFVLPAPCIGHPLGKGIGSCPNEGSIALLGLVEAPGGHPQVAIVTACPEHARGARMMLESKGLGDEVETWSTRTLAENWGKVIEAFPDLEYADRIA